MITTTNGKPFTHVESVDMARLVFKRFGDDPEAAAAAWRRLLENGCPVADFMALVEYNEHTPHCQGHCRIRTEIIE